MNFIRIVQEKNLSPRDKMFIEVASWSEYATNLNQSGISFNTNPFETNSDIMLFVVEKEEDNRHIKGGSISEFGTIYGMPTEVVSARMPINWDDFRSV